MQGRRCERHLLRLLLFVRHDPGLGVLRAGACLLLLNWNFVLILFIDSHFALRFHL